MYQKSVPNLKKAIILQVYNPKLKIYDLNEFKELAYAANYEIIEIITQKPKKINPIYILGKGKVDEISQRYAFFQIEKIPKKIERRTGEELVFLFNNRLTSSQIRNLSGRFQTKVIDRDLLILEIFELNATTYEAKLQIKLARMSLEISQKQEEISQKMKSERQTYSKGFIGKGYDAFTAFTRSYKKQQKKITKELDNFRKQREIQRKSRNRKKNLFKVSIVGYTNAGKTTFLNTIKTTNFKTKNSAFTTVSTINRRLEYLGDILIFTDTVGFISDIPHEIIDSFISTLEEIVFSDCILCIIDISDTNKQVHQKIQTTLNVLSKIGALNVPIVYAFNKIDKLSKNELNKKKEYIRKIFTNKKTRMLFFSAKEKKTTLKIVNILRMVKNKTLLVTSGKDNPLLSQETNIIKEII